MTTLFPILTHEIWGINYIKTQDWPPIKNSSVGSQKAMSEHIVHDLTRACTKRIRFGQDPEFKSLIDSRNNTAILDYLNKDDERDKLAHFRESLLSEFFLTHTDSGCRPPTELQQ